MRVSDLCTRRVMQVTAESSVLDAAELMRRHQVGALVVTRDVDGDTLPLGMLTDRDLVAVALANGLDPADCSVGQAMSPGVVSCRDGDDVFDVIKTMRHCGVRRMPVVDERGALVGLIAADDVIGGLAEQLRALSRSMLRTPRCDEDLLDAAALAS